MGHRMLCLVGRRSCPRLALGLFPERGESHLGRWLGGWAPQHRALNVQWPSTHSVCHLNCHLMLSLEIRVKSKDSSES